MNLTDPIFTDEAKARDYFESIRWPNGPFCPHCGETEKVYRLNGKSHRAGLLHCNSCDEAFTVTVGTVMERSHVPLNKWACTINTDEARMYKKIGKGFAAHGRVNHSDKEYAKKDGTTTNTVEGFFSIFKRGMVGTYQHCNERHLHRYLSEFDFRYSNRIALGVDDVMRTLRAIKGAEGKRLTYKRPRAA